MGRDTSVQKQPPGLRIESIVLFCQDPVAFDLLSSKFVVANLSLDKRFPLPSANREDNKAIRSVSDCARLALENHFRKCSDARAFPSLLPDRLK